MMKLVVLSCVLAAAAGSLIAPIAYTAPFAYTAPLLTPYNYRGPLSLAPGQPANILGADGRPLDTLDVNLDRSAHYTAKALTGAGVHLLKKRSVGLFAPLAYTAPFAYAAPLLTPHNYRGPLSLAPGQPANILAADGRPLDTLDVNLDRSAHFTAKALTGAGVHLLKKRSAPLIAPLAVNHVVVSPAHAPLAYSAPLLTTHVAAAPLTYTHAPLVHW